VLIHAKSVSETFIASVDSPKDDDGDEVEVYGVSILCNVFFNIEKAIQSKMESKLNLEIQAKKIRRDSDKKNFLYLWVSLYEFRFPTSTKGGVTHAICWQLL